MPKTLPKKDLFLLISKILIYVKTQITSTVIPFKTTCHLELFLASQWQNRLVDPAQLIVSLSERDCKYSLWTNLCKDREFRLPSQLPHLPCSARKKTISNPVVALCSRIVRRYKSTEIRTRPSSKMRITNSQDSPSVTIMDSLKENRRVMLVGVPNWKTVWWERRD